MKSSCVVFLTLVVALVSYGSFAQEATKPEAKTWTKTLEIKAEDNLIIYVDPGSIRLIPSDKKRIVIKATQMDPVDFPKIQFTTKAKDIRLDYKGDRSVPVAFDVPLSGKIKLSTNLGSVTLADVSGKLTVDSREGDVTTGNIDGDAMVTSGGEIDLGNVTGSLEVKNEHGDTYVRNVGGALNARTDDGDLTLGETAGNAIVSAGIGDVELRKVIAMATVTTDGGDIDVFEAPGMVIASSNNGDITLRKVSGAADVKSEDGEIIAEMNSGGGGASKFFDRSGDVTLMFPEGARATVEVRIPAAADTSTGTAAEQPGAAENDEEDQVTSEFKAEKTAVEGDRSVSTFEINGGGDSISVEALGGDVLLKRLIPRPAAPSAPAAPKKP
jgi:hypothetical protein